MNKFKNAWIDLDQKRPLRVILPLDFNSKYGKEINLSNIRLGKNNIPYPAVVKKSIVESNNHLFPVMLKKNKQFVKVGPIVGILTSSGKKGTKGNPKNYIDIIKTGISHGVFVYVFTAESVDILDEKVKAYIYLPKEKKWIKKMMPLPDVVYNRIPYHQDEKKSSVINIMHYFQIKRIPFFNSYFFNKWSLHEWLEQSSDFKNFIPRTEAFSNENLQSQLSQNKIVYLKPVHGKAGIGFFKIVVNNNSYLLKYQNDKGTYTKWLVDYSELWKLVSNIINDQKYIIQTGVDLLTYNGRPFDVRVLLQKDQNGEWDLTGVGIRVAGEKSITTHVPRGGYIASLDNVFSHSFDHRTNLKMKNNISELVVKIAKYIEQKSDYSLGEMSMDLGIDKKGQIWFFEANSKPMEFDEQHIRKLSLTKLINYFKYLSNF